MHHLAVVLAVAASPAFAFINHNLLVPRQSDSSDPSPTFGSKCSAEFTSLSLVGLHGPTPQPDLVSFVESYFDAYRTLTDEPDFCGWITLVPSSLTAELASYETAISSWQIANAALISALQQDCKENITAMFCSALIAPTAGPAATPLPAAATASTSTSTTAPVTIGPTSPIITGTVPTASSPVSTSTHTTSAAAPAAGLGFLVPAVAAAGFLAVLALL